jgi:hypothetical protein
MAPGHLWLLYFLNRFLQKILLDENTAGFFIKEIYCIAVG